MARLVDATIGQERSQERSEERSQGRTTHYERTVDQARTIDAERDELD